MRRDELSLPNPPSTDRPGDLWMCGNSAGSPCARGPNSRGQCPAADLCRPVRTWHGRRRRIAVATIALFALVLLGSLHPYFSSSVLKPGGLASPHSQILSGTLVSARCASCHPQASNAPESFFQSGSEGHRGVSQSDRCLDCHHATIAPATSRYAHNLRPGALATLRVASNAPPSDSSWRDVSPMISQDDVRCSVCHQEHLGADADLLAVSDAKCQSCHQNQFASFSDDHPDWHSWPYGRGGEIAFDHATHANQHFPSTNRRAKAAQFQCNDCHQRSPSNEILRTVSYEFACASCHDQALRAETSLGITLLAVPTLPVSATEKAGSWPEAALGFFDGELSPLSELLHRGDPLVTAEIRRIPRRDFSAIDESNAVETDAALRVAIAQRRLLRELARHGGESIQRRMAATPVAPRLFQPLLASLSPQMVQSAYRSWFPNDASSHQTNVGAKHFSPFSGSVSSVRHPFALVSDRIAGSLNTTAVEDEPTSATPQGHLAPFADESLLASDSMQPGLLDGDLLDEDLTGELSDDALLSDDSLINAQGLEEWNEQDEQLTEFTEGHSLAEPDPLSDSHHGSSERLADSSRFDAERMLPVGGWYRDDASLSIRYRGNGHADPVLRSIIEIASQLPSGDPVRQRLLKTRSVAACVSCHRSAPVSTGSWKSLRLEDRRGDFTKFSHEPHLNVAILSDCTHCHQVRPGRGLADLGLPNSDHASVAGSSTFTEQATNSLVTGAFMPPSGGDFLPLGRDSCVACHTKAAAGDACVQCHRYHIGPEASPPHVIDALPRSLQSE